MEVGHAFLARLGKRRLRPGGREATDWLLEKARLRSGTEVLEVACNMGTTTAELVKQYGCRVTALPFPDERFDVVINEAMLTMLTPENRARAVSEYFRVLKKGGMLLTHDVLLLEDSPELVQGLSRAINLRVYPLTEEGWREVFEGCGFDRLQVRHGPVSLMTFRGMVCDEGLWGAIRVFLNGRKAENREFFRRMSGFFGAHRERLNYIAVAGTKS